jgi:fimbrial chaperone protein
VRLARIAAPDLSQQLTYRLIVREVPEATQPKDRVLQIPIALALSMPVFITPPNAQRQIQCQPGRAGNGQLQVTCGNSGNAYAQVREVQVRQGGNVLARMEGGVYILPGARKAIAVPAEKPAPAGPAQVNVVFDDGKSQLFETVLP